MVFSFLVSIFSAFLENLVHIWRGWTEFAWIRKTCIRWLRLWHPNYELEAWFIYLIMQNIPSPNTCKCYLRQPRSFKSLIAELTWEIESSAFPPLCHRKKGKGKKGAELLPRKSQQATAPCSPKGERRGWDQENRKLHILVSIVAHLSENGRAAAAVRALRQKKKKTRFSNPSFFSFKTATAS